MIEPQARCWWSHHYFAEKLPSGLARFLISAPDTYLLKGVALIGSFGIYDELSLSRIIPIKPPSNHCIPMKPPWISQFLVGKSLFSFYLMIFGIFQVVLPAFPALRSAPPDRLRGPRPCADREGHARWVWVGTPKNPGLLWKTWVWVKCWVQLRLDAQ